MIHIANITAQQVELLDQIALCDTDDDVADLMAAVDPEYRHQILLLLEAVALAYRDSEVVDETDCAQARELFAQCINQEE